MLFSHDALWTYAKICKDIQRCAKICKANFVCSELWRMPEATMGFEALLASALPLKPLAKCASRLSSGRKCWTSKQSCQAGNCGCLSSLQQVGHASWALRTPCKMRWRNWIFADSAPTYQLVHFDTLTPHQPHPNFEINLQDVIHSKYQIPFFRLCTFT